MSISHTIHDSWNVANYFFHDKLSAIDEHAFYFCSMDIKEESGRRIMEARQALGLRLKDVASMVPGVSVSRLSNWEHGIRMVGIAEAKALSPVLKVSPEYILTLTDDKGDRREQALLDCYRHTDERGRQAILRVAEQESSYGTTAKVGNGA